jgi:hypothetical protein
MVARGDTRPVRLAYAAGQPENFACLDEIEAAPRVGSTSGDAAERGGRRLDGRGRAADHDRLRRLLDGLDRRGRWR